MLLRAWTWSLDQVSPEAGSSCRMPVVLHCKVKEHKQIIMEYFEHKYSLLFVRSFIFECL